MNNTILYTLPQWFIFAAIFVIVYGWVEKKKTFRMVGYSILTGLGIFSIFILSGDYFIASEFLTPEEIAREELDDEIVNEIPFQAKLFPAYVSFVLATIFALTTAILDIMNNNKYRWFALITGLVILFGFFIIVGALRSL